MLVFTINQFASPGASVFEEINALSRIATDGQWTKPDPRSVVAGLPAPLATGGMTLFFAAPAA